MAHFHLFQHEQLFAVGQTFWKDALLKKITLANYRQDRHYARIVKATEDLLRERGFVAPVELLIRMELLSPESVEDWRRGRIPYLERVICCNLSKASRILRILRMHAHDLDLKPLLTVYKRWTRGPRTLLRFSKTGTVRSKRLTLATFFLPVKMCISIEVIDDLLFHGRRPENRYGSC